MTRKPFPIFLFLAAAVLFSSAHAQLIDISYHALHELNPVTGDPLPGVPGDGWVAERFRLNRMISLEMTTQTDDDRMVTGILGIGGDYIHGSADYNEAGSFGMNRLQTRIFDGYFAFGSFMYRHGLLARLALNLGGGAVMQQADFSNWDEPERNYQGAMGLAELRVDLAFLRLFDAGAGIGLMARYRVNRLLKSMDYDAVEHDPYALIEDLEVPVAVVGVSLWPSRELGIRGQYMVHEFHGVKSESYGVGVTLNSEQPFTN